MSSSADPNNWVTNPPSTFVKVQGTSRETINGKLGLVLQYADDRQRYTVVLCESQDVVSLKPDNLVACGVTEKARAYYQMFQNNPDVRRQVQTVMQQIKARTGMRPEIFLALLVASIVVGWFFLGFSNVLMLISVGILGLSVVGPDLAEGKDWKTIARNAPNRWKHVVETQVPVVGTKIASNPILLNGLTALLVAFVLYSLVASPITGKTAAAAATASHPDASFAGSAAAASSPPRTLATADLQQKYYKLGFDDATAQREFGASLPEEPEPAVVVGVQDEDDDMAWRNNYSPIMDDLPRQKPSPFNLSTGLAAFAIYRTLSELARGPDGQFDLLLMRANLSNLPAWKLGLLGFSVYRVVSAFL